MTTPSNDKKIFIPPYSGPKLQPAPAPVNSIHPHHRPNLLLPAASSSSSGELEQTEIPSLLQGAPAARLRPIELEQQERIKRFESLRAQIRDTDPAVRWIQRLLVCPDRLDKRRKVHELLDLEAPSWERVVISPEFARWLKAQNPFSRSSRGMLFDALDFASGSDRAILSFFLRRYVALRGGAPTPDFGASLDGISHRVGELLLGKYELLDRLGSGGFGNVFLVYSHEVQQLLALKVLRENLGAASGAAGRFYREASLWTDIGQHPNLVSAEQVATSNGHVFLFMEYVEPDHQGYSTLEDHLRRGPIVTAQAIKWGLQCCDGMSYAISKGLRAHRDIKPANVLVDRAGTARLTDLGLAALNSTETSTYHLSKVAASNALQTMYGASFGTPPYMSPEQFVDATMCDEQSDIYSFGVMLFQMAAAGELPFFVNRASAGNVFEQYGRLHHRQPVPNLASPLNAVIQSCLRKLRVERFFTFGEVREALCRLADSIGVEVPKAPTAAIREAPWNKAQRGTNLLNLGRVDEAIAVYREALEDPLQIVGIHYSLGLALMKKKEFASAYENFKRVEGESRAGALGLMAICQMRLNNPQLALQDAESALALECDEPDALLAKGWALSHQFKHRLAIEAIRRYLVQAPSNGEAWLMLARSELRVHNHIDAKRAAARALESLAADEEEKRAAARRIVDAAVPWRS